MFRGFFWGAVLGVVAGLLFAPRKGEETRLQLRQRFDDIQSQTQTQVEQLRTQSSKLIEQGRQTVNQTLSRTQDATNDAATSAQNSIANA